MRKIIFPVWFAAALFLSFVPSSYADAGDHSDVVKKLDEIAKTQTQIMESLEQIKAELQIVKVRASDR